MDKFLFWQLDHQEPIKKEFTRDGLDFYSIRINGYLLMYARDHFRPDGKRMYVLGDEYAKCLGFFNYQEMRYRLRGLQYWRGMLTTAAVKRKLR